MSNMVVQEDVCPTCNSNSRFAEAIQIGEVGGGARARNASLNFFYEGSEVLNDALRGALEESLRINHLLAEDASQARFILNIHLVELGQPTAGFSATAFSVIRYTLQDKQTDEQVRDEQVESKFTVKLSQVPYGISRTNRAVEGSIRENIKQFIVQYLTEIKP